MNKKDSTITREDIRCETPQFKKIMDIYLVVHKNRSCPKSFYIIILVLFILIIIIILILIC